MERRGQPDHLLFFITMALLVIGLIMVLSASSYDAILHYDDAFYFFKKQLFNCLLGLVALIAMMVVKPEVIKELALPGFFICIVLMLLVLAVGVEVNGAKRWLGTASIRFAPAEVAKPVTIVFFAYWLANMSKRSLHSLKGYLTTGLLMLIIPVLIVIEDLGTAITLLGALFCMLIVAGAKIRHIVGTIIAGGIAVAALIIAKPYRWNRILAFLDPFADPLNTGYQAVQSLYALGSGWLFGVGLGNSRQKLLYLPERHTDFIFSIIGEELGFIGALFVIFLFCMFVWRGFHIASNIEDRFKALTAFGLTAVVGIQAAINIGVAVGALPVTGITLPFISYGGTSLIFMLGTVGFILNMSRYAKK